MGKDVDLVQAVRDEDLTAVLKILCKTRGQRSKLIGSVKKLNVNFQDASGMSALHQAALTGNIDVMKALLEHGAIVDITDSKQMRPLHYAAWQGKDSLVEVLLLHGSNVNHPAADGNTPLHLSSEHGHFCVVKKLLDCGANPTLTNNHHRTPLDVACEFGRIRVVEFLLDSELSESLINSCPSEDTVDNDRTTCLHLAARNGHVDIIRLLLEAGIDINRQTLQGTCLHEAAMFGKTDVVTLLLSCGVDVNRLNSYEQTALEVVNKFTATRGAREIKQLLREASSNLRARAVKDYTNLQEPTHLAFKEGDLITVTEQHATSGLWKGFKCTYSGVVTRPGFFPATAVVLIDPHSLSERKLTAIGTSNSVTADSKWLRRHCHNSGNRHVSSSAHTSQFSSVVGRDSSFPLPPSPPVKTKNSKSDSDTENGLSRYHVQQLLQVGQLQMACQACNGATQLQHRLSGQSCESGVSSVSSSSRQSYHSGSSSSQGSLDRLEESGYSSSINVHELLQQGLTDCEVMHTWLTSLHLDDFYQLFVIAGYDMPTISRMTPEDLTAIGITRPSVRKKLKAEIGKLTISDGIPDYKPTGISEWLNLLHLSEYTEILLHQGYSDIDSITDITWEDLEEIGINKLGHQKKMMLGIDRLKRMTSLQHALVTAGQTLDLQDPRTSPSAVAYDMSVVDPPLPVTALSAVIVSASGPAGLLTFAPVTTGHCTALNVSQVQPVTVSIAPVVNNYNNIKRQTTAFSNNVNVNVSLSQSFSGSLSGNNAAEGSMQSGTGGPSGVDVACGLTVTMSAGRPVVCSSPSPSSCGPTPNVTRSPVIGSAIIPGARRELDSDGDVTPTNERKAVMRRTVDNHLHTGAAASVTHLAAYITHAAEPKLLSLTAASVNSSSMDNYFSNDKALIDTIGNPGFTFSYGTLPRKVSQKQKLVGASAASTTTNVDILPAACCFNGYLDVASVEQSETDSISSPSHGFGASLPLDQNAVVSSSCDSRKEPPIPPKRTHSFHTEIRAPIINMNSSSTVSSSVGCQQSSSSYVCSSNSSTRPGSSSFVNSTDLFIGSETSLKEVIEQLEHSTSRRNTGPRLGDWQDSRTSNDSSSEDSDSGLDSRQSDSNTSLASCSGGSTDTNTLPFANENVGTIKQRGGSGTAKTSIVSTGADGGVELNASLFNANLTTVSTSGSVDVQADASAVESDTVFNDIDGMLLGLTAELDEMLKLQV